jgi:coenzyme F420 hydrogenase subunit beta
VRNQRGQELLSLLGDEVVTGPITTSGKRRGAVRGFMANVQRAAGGLPLRRMPSWLRPVVSWLMPRIGPRGLEFAKARVEMKAIESIIHLQRVAPRKVRNMVPAHIWALAEPYGLHNKEGKEP